MAFQIKNFTSITAGMINLMRGFNSQLTDFNVGSVTRTLIEAPAAEIEELYLQYLNGLLEAIPTAVYQAFDFDRLPATAARGVLRLTLDSPAVEDTLTTAGTVFETAAGLRYVLIADVLIETGETTADGTAVAETPGSAGNTLAHTIAAWPTAPVGATVTNPQAFTGGRDEESDSERKARFQAYIASLSRGTTTALEYAARLAEVTDAGGRVIERVTHVGLVEEIPGQVRLYIHNGAGDTTQALIDRAQQIIDGYIDEDTGDKIPGWRSAGIRVEVGTLDEYPVDLTAVVHLLPGYAPSEIEPQLEAAYVALLGQLNPGDTLFISVIASRLLSVAGVESVDLETPAANVNAGPQLLLLPGTITLTYAA